MSDMILNKEALAHRLAEKTDFYVYNMREVTDALAEIVLEQLKKATFDEPAGLTIAPGVIVGGKRVAEREYIDPRNQEMIITPEKVIPYTDFRISFRRKLYEELSDENKR